MCGIAGIFHSGNPESVDAEILQRMNRSLTHRGPDDEGYWVQGNIGLAMRRLSIIDLEGGHQPISNETGEIRTVFNGEIYNFQELRKELIQKGHAFRTHSDTEVIVHLYEEDGEAFVHKLRGMFAIALWDERVRKLLLVRDRIGIKPLHYWFQNGTLIFGSEIKALLQFPAVGREISLTALSHYLSFLYIPAPRTIYQEIHKLLPGHFLRCQNGEIQIEPYWDFTYRLDPKVREEEWMERLRLALDEAVNSHCISDVPIGAFLSGGMDSSTIVAWMSRGRSRPSPVKTYSIGFKESQFNELPYARQVADYFGTEHHEKLVEAGAFSKLPEIVSSFDEPFADSSAIPTYFVSEFARQDVKVALSGDGGDELFGGYLWTRKEIWIEKYRRLPSFLKRQIEKMFLSRDYTPLRETGLKSILQRFLYDAGLTPADSFARRAMSFQPWMKKEIFQPWVLEGLRADESMELVRGLFDRTSAESLIDKFLYLDSKIYLPDDLLAKVDRMSMIHSLEVRVPLLDHKVVELACSIPFSFKFKGNTTKYILKKAMENNLPPVVLKQRKQGFSIPIQQWFRNELASFARNLLLDDQCLSRKFFRMEYVQWLLDQHSSGRQRFGTQLYALVVFELWCKHRHCEEAKPTKAGAPAPALDRNPLTVPSKDGTKQSALIASPAIEPVAGSQ